MLSQSSYPHIFGFDFQKDTIKGIEISYQGGKIKIERLIEIPLDDTSKPTGIPNINSYSPQAICITSLPYSKVIVRPVDIKLTKDKDIEAVFPYQAEPLLPYSLDEGVIDKVKISSGPQGSLYTLLSVRKDHLKAHLDQWSAWNVTAEIVSCAPLALAYFTKACHPHDSDSPILTLHLGIESTLCVLSIDGKLLAAHWIPESLSTCLQAIMQDHKCSFSEAEKWAAIIDYEKLTVEQYPCLIEVFSQWRQAIARLIFAVAKQAKGKGASRIMLTGEGGKISHMVTSLCHLLGKNITSVEPIMASSGISTKDLQKFAIPIGLAMSATPDIKIPINFRKKEFFYPYPWLRVKKPILIYFSLCAVVALCCYLSGMLWLGKKELYVKQEFVNLLGTLGKTFETFETEYNKKNPAFSGPLALEKLSNEDVLQRLYYIQEEIKRSPDTFPLQPNVPRVSDVLAWLNSHPSIIKKDDKGQVLDAVLHLESFSYTLVKRPDEKKKNEKYQVKVELEISSITPRAAREFHDALIAPNDFVDPKSEVKWSSNRGRYRTSFYLKDKTIYP